ncbi:MAG: glycosyltransferase family 2 protein, partial [Synechococcaceae cyanobacterium]|nr:glycosyltransferase family 2 protein [Synechococcaceae cyanobacterium]
MKTKNPLIGIATIKNEEDIIEAFLRHNLKFGDHLYILDNGSVDQTPQILREFSKQGWPLTIFYDPSFRHNQSTRLTRLY